MLTLLTLNIDFIIIVYHKPTDIVHFTQLEWIIYVIDMIKFMLTEQMKFFEIEIKVWIEDKVKRLAHQSRLFIHAFLVFKILFFFIKFIAATQRIWERTNDDHLYEWKTNNVYIVAITVLRTIEWHFLLAALIYDDSNDDGHVSNNHILNYYSLWSFSKRYDWLWVWGQNRNLYGMIRLTALGFFSSRQIFFFYCFI